MTDVTEISNGDDWEGDFILTPDDDDDDINIINNNITNLTEVINDLSEEVDIISHRPPPPHPPHPPHPPCRHPHVHINKRPPPLYERVPVPKIHRRHKHKHCHKDRFTLVVEGEDTIESHPLHRCRDIYGYAGKMYKHADDRKIIFENGRPNKNAVYFLDVPRGLTETGKYVYPFREHKKYSDYELDKIKLISLINNNRGISLSPDDFELSRPTPIEVEGEHYNTKITLIPKNTLKHPNCVTVCYYRHHISTVFRRYNTVDDITSTTLSELIPLLTDKLTSLDYIDTTVPPYDPMYPNLRRQVLVKANESSLFYYGSTIINLDNHVSVDGLDMLVVLDSDEPRLSLMRYMTKEDDPIPLSNITTYTEFRLNNIFKMSINRYVAFGEFSLYYEDTNGEVNEYTGHTLILNKDLQIVDGLPSVFNQIEYDPKKLIKNGDGSIVSVVDNKIYFFNTVNELISTVVLDYNPVAIYPSKDNGVYVVEPIVGHHYTITKIMDNGTKYTYLDNEGNCEYFHDLYIISSNGTVDPKYPLEIQEDDLNHFYILFEADGTYAISSNTNIINDRRFYTGKYSEDTTAWNPLKRFYLSGKEDEEYKTILPGKRPSLVAKADTYIESGRYMDLSRMDKFVNNHLTFTYVYRASPITGVPGYGWLIQDESGRDVSHRYLDTRASVIDQVLDVRKLPNGGYVVVGRVVTDPNGVELNQYCIIKYNKNGVTTDVSVIPNQDRLVSVG